MYVSSFNAEYVPGVVENAIVERVIDVVTMIDCIKVNQVVSRIVARLREHHIGKIVSGSVADDANCVCEIVEIEMQAWNVFGTFP